MKEHAHIFNLPSHLTDDIVVPQAACMADYSQHTQHVFVQPLNEREYNIIPVYVANQFSLECINQHLQTINAFLASNSQGKCLKRSSLKK